MRSVDDVYEKVLAVHEDVIGLREDFGSLKEHVNDEQTNLRDLLALKQDRNSLLSSLGFQLLNHKTFRWAAGSVAAAILATAASNHWAPWVERLVHWWVGI